MKALAAQGKKAEAIRLAESSRSPWASDLDIDRMCEEMLLTSGLTDEAYRRCGLRANQAGTYLALAAKDAKLFDEAIALANRTPCSPQTLTRAACNTGPRKARRRRPTRSCCAIDATIWSTRAGSL